MTIPVYLDPLDPPLSPDGLCASCGEPKNAEVTRYAGDQAVHDPFCSAKCARSWYGCPLPEPSSRREVVA